MRGLLIIAAAFVLPGCAMVMPSFSKEGMTSDGYFADRYQCSYDTKALDIHGCGHASMYSRCMIVKGYRIVPKTGNVDQCITDLKREYTADTKKP